MSMADELYAALAKKQDYFVLYNDLGKMVPGLQTLNPRGIYEFTPEGCAAIDELVKSDLIILNWMSMRLKAESARTKVRRKIEDLIRKDKGVLDKVANFLNIE